MNRRLQAILDLIQQSESLTPEEKKSLAAAVKESDKEITITEFKLERTEKVKRTTAILLEETIAELEQKRKSVEAQNRELEIEAALERVRSRSIAMRQSSELGDLSFELVKQVQALGIATWHCAFNIYDEGQESSTEWGSNSSGSYPIYKTPREGIFKRYYEIGQRGETLHVEVIGEDKCAAHYDYLCTLPGVGDTLVKLRDSGTPFPKSQIDHVAYFKYGYLLFITFEPTPEAHDVFKRFAKVFEQTYTRFLDLQKAEAQAKEAKIEVGLERVRTRAMAMQTSEELNALIGTVFSELTKLDLVLTRCVIMTYDQKTNDARWWMANSEAPAQPMNFFVQYHEHPPNLAYFSAWRERTVKWIYNLEGRVKREWDDFIFSETELKLLPDFVIAGMKAPDRVYLNASFYNSGNLTLASLHPLSDEHFDILIRFAKVFDLTYTRFNDLKQAEAQAREAKIEAALERVRTRTMAMQRSEELLDVASILFQQVKALGVPQWNCGFNIWDIGDKEFTFYPGTPDGIISPSPCKIPLTEHPVFISFDESRKRGDELFVYEKEGEFQAGHYQYMLSLPGVGDLLQSMLDAGFQLPTFQIDHVANFSYGNLIFITFEHFPEMHDVFKRFAKVFEQTYTRFLDLKKAEAQAREAQIETALEKVRSRSLAMHKSDELQEVINTLFERLKELEIETDTAAILISKKGTRDIEAWIQNQEHTYSSSILLPYNHKSILSREVTELRESATDLISKNYSVVDKNDYFNHLFTHSDMKNIPESRKSFVLQAQGYTVSNAHLKHSGILLGRYADKPFSGGEHKILKRFAAVFEQAYIRFLDLQKAEAQTREAQIEASLERVRSKSMAMHKSEEILDVVKTMCDQFTHLGFEFHVVNIGTDFRNQEHDLHVWIYGKDAGNIYPHRVRIPYIDNALLFKIKESLEKGVDFFSITLSKDEKDEFYQHLFSNTIVGSLIPDERKQFLLNEAIYSSSIYILRHTLIILINYNGRPFSEEHNAILKRFANVLEQSYTRFMDLQKAEAQAREATIEASLEKVRGKAMSMHNSNDLTATASLVFTELRKLGINSFRSGVGLLTKEDRNVKLYSATSSEEGGSFSVVGWAVLDHHPVLSKTYDSWVNNEDYFPVLKGETLKSYYEKVVATFAVPVEQSEGYEQYGYFLPFTEGLFYGWSEKPYTEAEIKILHRFKAIVDLTFRRYMELQKSEENAMEAIRQASLDRVRAEIASMRTTADLDRITPLIWKELNILNIPFVRCGVFIMDEAQHQIHTFLSTPEGKAIAAFNLPYDTTGNVGEILTHWLDKKMYISHWNETAFSELAELLVQQKAIPSKEVYMNTVPVDGIHLHCLPFLQGMLYVGNTSQLQGSDIHLIQSVADAFSTAYARYEDFNKLESAKAQIERTLTDLKQTQALLVQSEKMASLGELTAGIAHEIQNPLNFVNNFSEVSNELLEEMKEEIQKGNYKGAEAITDDIRQNLEKILHHGKRADGIVKGMLQHSRSSSGVKEPTDINALADEYLRLAYHGFRAKDKTFNASTATDLDRSIGKINVVPQDIGRVVLNLITNAFYAVTEKQNQTNGEYRPTVSLTTKKHDGCVLISVKDNGKGISQKVLDKIFQPFFTTKPTGQGTGLGLSLSYDIVKAHGGELKVKTMEGEGSEFTLSLPTPS